MKLPVLFVDTSAWVALLDSSDGLHRRASAFWHKMLAIERRFLTSTYVLDETLTLLRRRRQGLRMAILFHELVTTSKVIEVAEVDSELSAFAWEIFMSYQDKVLSFTDCTSFALMQRRTLLEAFTFEADFRQVGFIVFPRDAQDG